MRTWSSLLCLLAWQRLAGWQHVGLALLLVLKSALLWGWPFVVAGVLAALARGPESGFRLLCITLGLASVALLANPPLHRWYIWRTAAVVRRMEASLRQSLMERIHHADADQLDALDSGAMQTRVMRDVDQIASLAAMWWHHLLGVLVSMIVVIITTAWQEPRMLVGYVAILPIAMGVSIWALARLEPHHAKFRSLVEHVGGMVADSLRTLPVTRAHGVDRERLGVVGAGLARLQRRGLALDGSTAWVDAAIWSLFEVLKIIQLGWLAWQYWNGYCTLPDVVLVHGLFIGLIGSISGIVWALPGLQMGCASVEAVREQLARPLPASGQRRVAQVRGTIQLENVDYRYPGRVQAALMGIDFHITSGEHIALAGSSGSGKSTLAQIALGLRFPSSGRVLLDGIAVQDLDLPWWRRHVAVVSQRVILANASVRENVAFGSHGITDAAIHRALEAVALDHLLTQLPHALNTRLGEDGVILSGGQRQRLTIARALVRDPRLVVLDEADAALDPFTEGLVQDALNRLCAGRTVLTLSHRPSALSAAQRVVLLDHGRIIAEGPFPKLAHLLTCSSPGVTA